jgi:hypothetical protein
VADQRAVAAYRSLAKSRGVAFGDVVEAAATDDLRRVIELRDVGKERRIAEQYVIRIRNLDRLRVLSILQDGNY